VLAEFFRAFWFQFDQGWPPLLVLGGNGKTEIAPPDL
jgi:hypothetical protein